MSQPHGYDLFSNVTLKAGAPGFDLRKGMVATIVEIHPGCSESEPGYSLEVFNAAGETVAVVTVRESQIELLPDNAMR